jgi:hypothetical protein
LLKNRDIVREVEKHTGIELSSLLFFFSTGTRGRGFGLFLFFFKPVALEGAISIVGASNLRRFID